MLKRVLAFVGIVSLITVGITYKAQADVPSLSGSGSFTATGSVTVGPINGQGACTLNISGGATATVTVENSNDAFATVVVPVVTKVVDGTQITLPVSAATSVYGNYSIAGLGGLNSYTRARVATYGSGTVSLFLTCGAAGGSTGGSGSGGAVTQGTVPWVVNTVAPAPVVSPGLYQGVTETCPSAAPAPVNGVYVATCDSSGFVNVNVKSLPNVLPSPTSTLPVTTPAPCVTIVTLNQCTAALAGPASATTAPGGGNLGVITAAGEQLTRVNSTPIPAPSTTATNMAATPAPVSTPAAALIFYQGIFTNSDSATIYCMIYDTSTSPTVGTTAPKFTVAVPAGQTTPVFSGPTQGSLFASGIYGACSTTYQGATLETAGKVFFTAIWGK